MIRRASVALTAMLLIAACSTTLPNPSPTPSSNASASPSASPSSVAPSGSASVAPGSPGATATSSATTAADCPVQPSSGKLPSDRLLNVQTASGPDGDQFTLVFGGSSIGPGGTPTGELAVAKAPYTFAGSGQAITMIGHRVIQIILRNMSLAADTGDAVYAGPREVKTTFATLRHAVLFDESEGQYGWYLGFDGPGCVTLTTAANTVVVTFAPR